MNMRESSLGITLALVMTIPVAAQAGHHNQHAVGLVRQVLDSTSQYYELQNAIDAGYVPATACVSSGGHGAMGVHYVDLGALDGVPDPTHPEALVYEPTRHGHMRLVAAEYIVLADLWHAENPAVPPTLMGQQMIYVGAPNRYVLPPFYELHVWAFRDNKSGVFSDHNPDVTCEYFDPTS